MFCCVLCFVYLPCLNCQSHGLCTQLEHAEHVLALLKFRVCLFVYCKISFKCSATRVFLESCCAYIGTAVPSFLFCCCVLITWAEYGSYVLVISCHNTLVKVGINPYLCMLFTCILNVVSNCVLNVMVTWSSYVAYGEKSLLYGP